MNISTITITLPPITTRNKQKRKKKRKHKRRRRKKPKLSSKKRSLNASQFKVFLRFCSSYCSLIRSNSCQTVGMHTCQCSTTLFKRDEDIHSNLSASQTARTHTHTKNAYLIFCCFPHCAHRNNDDNSSKKKT